MGNKGGVNKQNSQRDLKLNLGKLSRSNLLAPSTPTAANTNTPNNAGTPNTAQGANPLTQSNTSTPAPPQTPTPAPVSPRFDERFLSGKIRVQNLLMAMIKEKCLENKLLYPLLSTEHVVNLLDALFEAYDFAHRVLANEPIREALETSK